MRPAVALFAAVLGLLPLATVAAPVLAPPDAGIDGLMQAYAEGFEVLRKSEFDFDLQEVAGIWRYGSVVRSWLLELLHDAFEQEGSGLERIRGFVEDSGEGRWTVAEAIAEDVPVPVISAALFARFASREEEAFAAKVNAALRAQFGGHAVKSNEGTGA